MKICGLSLVKRRVLTVLLLLLLYVSALGPIFPAFRLCMLASPEETAVAVNPSVIGASPGQYFTINVTITNVTNLFGWGFRLKWPYGFLDVEAENITEGSFLKQGGTTGFAKKTFEGYIDVGCTLLGVPSGVNGSGTLATVTFRVLTTENFTLDLYSVTLLARVGDSSLQVIGDWEYKDSPDDGYLYNTWPTNIIVGAVVAVAVSALFFVFVYAKKKRKPPNSDSTAFLGQSGVSTILKRQRAHSRWAYGTPGRDIPHSSFCLK